MMTSISPAAQLVGQFFVVGFDHFDALRAERLRDHRRQAEIEAVFLLAVVDEVQRRGVGLHPNAQHAGLFDVRERRRLRRPDSGCG